VEYRFLNSACDYTIILSGDCLILFEHINEQNAKIIFWCSLYAISDVQIIQSLKSASINFFEIKQNKDFLLKLYIENIVLFRDTLLTRMKNLNIKISIKIVDSNSEKNEKRRMTMKDMAKMSLADIEKNINEMKQSIDKGEIDEYTINTYATLCGKAGEMLNASFKKEDAEKQKKYIQMMNDVYKLEKIEDFSNKNDIKENNGEDLNNIKDKNGIELIEENKNGNGINNNKNSIENDNNININEIKDESDNKNVNEIKEN